MDALFWRLVVLKVVNVWRFDLDNRFGKPYRLLKTEDFSSVFAFKKSRSRSFIQILYSADNHLGYARLGLVVSKKVAKRANRRNYMKRSIREWFRQHKQDLPSIDFIVRVRVPFDKRNMRVLWVQLTELMVKPK